MVQKQEVYSCELRGNNMALKEYQVQFVRSMTSLVKKYNNQYQIDDSCVCAIVAQSCNESNWGRSQLSSQYFNHWGMKCGSHWTGKSVNMETHEETPAGTIKVNSDFRVYDSFELGVVGYFEFIQASRYLNLRDCRGSQDYLQTIKDDGWATSSTYVSDIMKIVNQINYLVDDTPPDSNPEPPQPPPPYGDEPSFYTENVQIAMQVFNGMWGDTPEDIRANLTYAGYDYEEIVATQGGMISSVCKRKKKRGVKK